MTDSNTPIPDLLKLEGYEPQKVHVKIFDVGGTPTVGFALEGGDYYSEGIAWKCKLGSDYAKFVTFVFAHDVTKVECEDLFYSATFRKVSHEHTRQDMCIGPVTVETEYPFFVYPAPSTTNGSPEPIDPKIVVTPIASA